jgi:hypothetical protein
MCLALHVSDAAEDATRARIQKDVSLQQPLGCINQRALSFSA